MGLTQVNADGVKDDAISAGKIPDDAIGLAHLAAGTDGQVITYDASGNPVAVGPGTDGQVLTSTGAGSPPAFEDAVSEGTQVKSTGESGGTKFLREDGDGTCSWQTLPSSGAALTGSTNNTVVTVTGANALAGEANLTFDGNNLTVTSSGGVITTDTNGFITSKQALDAATAGGALIGQSNRGNLGRFFVGQTTTSADGGYATIDTCASGSTTITERVRVDSSGNLKVNDGNLVIGTSGHGIDFSADGDSTNASGTASAHLLHDYEEGTWTPTLVTGVTSYNSQTGYYTKVGRLVTANGYINVTTDSTSNTDYARVYGLPFTSDNNASMHGVAIGWWYGLPENVPYGYLGSNATFVTLLGENGSGSRDHVSHNDIWQSRSSARIQFTVSYVTTS